VINSFPFESRGDELANSALPRVCTGKADFCSHTPLKKRSPQSTQHELSFVRQQVRCRRGAVRVRGLFQAAICVCCAFGVSEVLICGAVCRSADAEPGLGCVLHGGKPPGALRGRGG